MGIRCFWISHLHLWAAKYLLKIWPILTRVFKSALCCVFSKQFNQFRCRSGHPVWHSGINKCSHLAAQRSVFHFWKPIAWFVHSFQYSSKGRTGKTGLIFVHIPKHVTHPSVSAQVRCSCGFSRGGGCTLELRYVCSAKGHLLFGSVELPLLARHEHWIHWSMLIRTKPLPLV